MRILFAVSNDNITTSVVNKYQQKYKEIITSKNVYYFNAIIKELQKNKSYDAIVIGEDLEPISNNNYEAIDKFLFEKLDGISDEASKLTGEDIPIIFICSDRRTTADRLLIKLFGIGIYNAIIGNDRSIDTVCNLINKPRNKKEAKLYYKIESEDVGMYENSSEQDVSETEIQNILSHYRKIGSNVKRCVDSFDKIAEQYNDTQLRVIVNFFPAEVKRILEENSNTYRKLMMGGTVLSDGTYSPYNRQNPKKPGNLDVLTKDLEKTNLSKPVIIPSTININNRTNQNFKSNKLENQNIPNNNSQVVRNNAQLINNVQGVKEKMQPPINNNQMNNGNNLNNMNVNNGNYNNNNINNGFAYNGNINNTNVNNASVNSTGANNANLNNANVNNASVNSTNVNANSSNMNNNVAGNNTYNNIYNNTGISNNNETDKVVPEMTQKRGRGRPRKIVSPVVQPINSLSPVNNTSTAISELPPIQSIDNVQKRRRGRPSKKSLENVQNPSNTEIHENNNVQEQKPLVNNNQGVENQPFNIPQEDVLPGLEESNDTVDLFSMDPIDDSIMDLDKIDSNQNGVLPGFENDIENLNNNSNDINNSQAATDDNNLFDLDIEETNTNQNNANVMNSTNNDINSNPYSEDIFNQNNSQYGDMNTNTQVYENMNTPMFDNTNNTGYENTSANNSQYGNIDTNTQAYENVNTNSSVYGNMNTSMYDNTNNSDYGNINDSQYANNNSYAAPNNNMQDNYNDLINTQNQMNVNTNVIAGNGKIVSFIGTSKNGISFIVNNLSQLLSQSGIKTAILDLTKNKNSYYMFTDNDGALMKKATESMKNLSKGIIDGLNVNKNLTVFTSLPDEIEILNSDVMLQTLSNNFEIILLDCDYDTDVDYFVKSNEIYLVQSMDTFTIQPLTQFLSNLKLKNALDETKLRIIINKYVKLRKLDEKMIIGGMSKYNEPSMTLQRDLFNAQTIKYVCVPFETETYARYLESIAMCNLSLNGYSQNFLNSLEELRRMVYPLVSGGYSNNNTQNNTEEKHGLFGGKKNKTQQTTQFSNNVNDTLNKMRTNNF